MRTGWTWVTEMAVYKVEVTACLLVGRPQGRLPELRWPGLAEPSHPAGSRAGLCSLGGSGMSSELRAQPWKLEPMETAEPTLGDWNLAPKDNKGSTEK